MNTTHPARLLMPGANQIAIALLARALATPKYVADVHVCWSAHVNQVDVTIYRGGWISHESPDYKQPESFTLYLDDSDHLEHKYFQITALLDKLEAETGQSPEREQLIAETKATELRRQAQALLDEANKLTPVKRVITAERFEDLANT